MADQEAAEPGPSAWPPWISLLVRAMSKRRTWVALFLAVHAALLSSSWSLLASVLAWYYSAAGGAAAMAHPAATWPAALHASVMYGAVFGLLSRGAVRTGISGRGARRHSAPAEQLPSASTRLAASASTK